MAPMFRRLVRQAPIKALWNRSLRLWPISILLTIMALTPELIDHPAWCVLAVLLIGTGLWLYRRYHPTAILYRTAQFIAPLWTPWNQAALLTDAEGRIVAVNPAAERVTGWPQPQLVGQRAPIPPAFPSFIGQTWHRVLEHCRPSGEYWWSEEDWMPIRQGRRIIGYWTVIRDLSETNQRLRPLHGSLVDETNFHHVFQPVVRLTTGETIGYEALLRPDYHQRPLSPGEFFALMVETGDLVHADLSALDALTDALRLCDWPPDIRLFVNVHPATLAFPEQFLPRATALQDAVSPRPVVWEITEHQTHLYADWTRLADTYPGLSFAQDDVGAGDEDLLRLSRTRPDWIKLDSAWVHAADRHLAARQLLASLLEWAHHQQILVIAEGIETVRQKTWLTELGVDGGQGFYLGRPAPLIPAHPRKPIGPKAATTRRTDAEPYEEGHHDWENQAPEVDRPTGA
ncbi:diguanylate cyclase/phosphodiesterase [Sulfobacillus acidophilus TPY]|uniref:Diguanylate phosphodiesterase n=1 Tax=Sulfobacillus acidophilus (strain ATCC 700253 / DSM 10332 / NAL) TaxID=679936 RepID=G8TT91_SULAD|nr:diguanylate cyclase/phosphodiesterase [Sulfobacillus acidophilus TPY]AEW06791.1 diguanylate phosphodiesterase [Sulfobacillus acidophilus DSM 10332]